MSVAPILPYRITRNDFITSNVIQLDCAIIAEERPAFKAGQFMMLHWKDELGGLIDKPHAYSIASAPHEPGFSFCIKVYGPYTTRLAQELSLGSTIHLQGPYGLFTLQKIVDERVVMLAGGVGIAPFRSMILNQLVDDASTAGRTFYVLYSNKTKISFPFKEELDALSAQHPGWLRIVYTITQEGGADWNGRRGRWTADSIKEEIGDWAGSIFFVCGPPPFVVEMQEQLATMGVEKRKVKIEKFT